MAAASPGWELVAFIIPAALRRKRLSILNIQLYVGNLSRRTTREDLNALFSRAGDVIAADLIADGKSGESKGFAFITMSAQSEADKAESMFDGYSLLDHELRVRLVKPRPQRGLKDPAYTP